MPILHCLTNFGQKMHGVTKSLKSGTFWMRCRIYLWSVHYIFSEDFRENDQGVSGLENELARTSVLAFLPITQYMQSQVNFRRCDGNALGHFLPWTAYFVEYLMRQYPMLTRTPKTTLDTATESIRQNVWAYGKVSKNISLNVNWKLLLMSGLNFGVWVYVSSNEYVV
jgi:hypothetical protein